ncbi:MAG: HAMP domain-containing protein [Peptococcaceae bacterium]|nr:MAG: HAMP domain-containing protein [Peptococcaceae bacterium]
MNLIRRSILLKLWLLMVLLVIIVMGITSILQAAKLKNLYYSQQADQLIKEGENIAESLAGADLAACQPLIIMTGMMNTNVMVIDREGTVKECAGMGMMRHGVGAKISMAGHHGMPWRTADLERVWAGKSISSRGYSSFLDSEVLSVAVPVKRDQEVAGAVVLSASLAPIQGRLVNLQKITLYTGLGGVLLATLLSLLFSRSLSRPLLEMNKIARALANGDYSQRVGVKSEDEVGALAFSLNYLGKELQEKVAALEHLNQTRRDFVTNVSHELRTPLTIMQGFTEALLDGMAESDADRQRYLENILAEILRLRRLVAELLDLRRMELGQMAMCKKEISFINLAGQIMEKFQPVGAQKGVEIKGLFPKQLPAVFADPDRLEQVLVNLLDNALRAAPKGGWVKLSVRESEGRLQVSVSDNGPGIPLAEQSLIWERFHKTDRSRSRTGSGTGLGLAIAKQIVEAHGGNIGVVSEPGNGSTFTFTIPLMC